MASKKNGNNTSRHLDIAGFPLDSDMTTPERVAAYLDWAAKEYPGQFTAYNVLYKAIQGQKATPQLRSQVVEDLRRKMQGVKRVLETKYNRVLVSQTAIGVRATVDSADTLTAALPKRMKRLQSAKNAVVRATDMIDPTKIPNTAEYRPWREWLNRDVKDVRRLLTDGDFDQKLLPPSTEQKA